MYPVKYRCQPARLIMAYTVITSVVPRRTISFYYGANKSIYKFPTMRKTHYLLLGQVKRVVVTYRVRGIILVHTSSSLQWETPVPLVYLSLSAIVNIK